jgi:hypothetical protein|tara:strand:+ start:10387 stop:10617 length:231 start_codon:yes stop_codon:yes gene_type:complete
MEISPILFWNGVLTLVIAPAIWMFRSMLSEIKRIDILINKTREEYAKRDDVKEDMHTVMDALQRLEDKLDKILIGK